MRKSFLFILISIALYGCADQVHLTNLELALEKKVSTQLVQADELKLWSRFKSNESLNETELRSLTKATNRNVIRDCFNNIQNKNILGGFESFSKGEIKASEGVSKRLYLQCNTDENRYVALLAKVTSENEISLLSYFDNGELDKFSASQPAFQLKDIEINDNDLARKMFMGSSIVTIVFIIKSDSISVKISDRFEYL